LIAKIAQMFTKEFIYI